MIKYDKFPGLDNIEAEEIEAGIFKVKEPFLIDIPTWFNGENNMPVAAQIFDEYEDQYEMLVYGFIKDRHYQGNMRRYVHALKTTNPDIVYFYSFPWKESLGGAML